MEECKEFSFFRGKVSFKQPKKHRLSVIELLFVDNLKGIKRSSEVLDLGAGFGTLSILIALKYHSKVWALERDSTMLKLLKYNIELNRLNDKIHIIEGDLKEYKSLIKKSSFDCVVANPPFYREQNVDNPYHFENDTGLNDFINAGVYALRDGGYLNILIPSTRLYEVCRYISNHNISIAYMRFFYPKEDKNAKLVRIVCIKNAKSLVNVEKPLIINTKTGGYTDEVNHVIESMI